LSIQLQIPEGNNNSLLHENRSTNDTEVVSSTTIPTVATIQENEQKEEEKEVERNMNMMRSSQK
jgi:hypothetical protein